jgi:hypothetical protein
VLNQIRAVKNWIAGFTLLLLAACGRPPDVPPVEGIIFEPASISTAINIGDGQEVTVAVKSHLTTDASFDLVMPSLDVEDTIIVDVDQGSIPPQLAQGESYNLNFLILCPVVSGSYTAEISIVTTAATAKLPVQVECKDAPIETIVKDNVAVVDEATSNLLVSYNPDSGLLEYSAQNEFLAGLEIGDVIVGQHPTIAPYGFLRTITNIQTDGGRVLLETTEAGLDSVFRQAEFDNVYVPDGPEDIGEVEIFYPGITFSTETVAPEYNLSSGMLSPQALEMSFSFDEVLFDQDGNKSTTEDQFKINGSLKVKSSFETKGKIITEWYRPCKKFNTWFGKYEICSPIKIPKFSLYVRLAARLDEQANFRASGNVSFAAGKPIPFAKVPIATTFFYVGPVPVYIDHSLTFNLDTNFKLTARLTYEVRQSLSLMGGVEYNHGLRAISEKKTTFSETLDFAGNLEASVYFNGRWESKVYGIIGPFAQLTAGPKLTASLAAAQQKLLWKIEACAEGRAGTVSDIKIWGKPFGKSSFTLFKGCSVIKQGEKDVPGTQNHPPVLTIENPSYQVLEDTQLDLGDTNRVADQDGDNFPLEISITMANGALSLPTAGLTFSQGDGQLDTRMVFQATPSAADGAVAAMSFLPASDFTGTANIAISVTDKNGPGNATTVSGGINITVAEVNDAPVARDDSLPEQNGGTTVSIDAFTLTENDASGPDNESSQSLAVVEVSNPVGGSVSLEGVSISFVPWPEFEGEASFNYTVSDNGLTAGADDFKTGSARVSFFILSPTLGKIVVTPENNQLAVYVEIDGTVFFTDPGTSVEKTLTPGNYQVVLGGGSSYRVVPDGTGQGHSNSYWGPNEWFECPYDHTINLDVFVPAGETVSINRPYYQIHGSVKVVYSGFTLEDVPSLSEQIPAPDDEVVDTSNFCGGSFADFSEYRAFEGGVMDGLETSTRNQVPGNYLLNPPSFRDCAGEDMVTFEPVYSEIPYTIRAQELTVIDVVYNKITTEQGCQF